MRPRSRGVEYGNAVKIAWETPRFWEAEDHIYGGISWVKGPTALVWYPSDRFFSPKGILLGAYARGTMPTPSPTGRSPSNSSRVARDDRDAASGPRQGFDQADGDRVVESALHLRHHGPLAAR